MRKLKKIGICAALIACAMMPQSVRAVNFAENEDYYRNFCSGALTSSADIQVCKEFKEYYRQKTDAMQSQINNINSDLNSIKSDMDSLTATINTQQQLIDEYTDKIAENDQLIEKIQAEVTKLEEQVAETQKDIDARDELIRNRMRSEQASVGTNMYVDFIMGASDLIDLIRIIEGMERITISDQEQIEALEEDRSKLERDKSEQERLRTEQEDRRRENEIARQSAEVAKKNQEDLLAAYHQKEAELLEQKRAVQVDIDTLKDNMANINLGVDGVTGNSHWMMPVAGYIFAGTWAYPDGGLHLGLDIAGPIGTTIVSPINGIVLYANNPVGTNTGYLGNWSGYPAGGGNTVLIVGEVNGITYAVSFAHMAQENFYARGGMTVDQGQPVGARGNSGNSSGPHTHIEVFNLGTIGLQGAISLFYATGADFAFGTGWNMSSICSVRGTPCRERPEQVFS